MSDDRNRFWFFRQPRRMQMAVAVAGVAFIGAAALGTVLLAVLFLDGGESGCRTEDGELVVDVLQAYAGEWDDTVEVASSSSRIALSGPIQDLQRIRRDVRSEKWPQCAEDAQRALVNMMDAMIDGFITFLSQEPDRVVQNHFEDANDYQSAFRRAIREMNEMYSSSMQRPPLATAAA